MADVPVVTCRTLAGDEFSVPLREGRSIEVAVAAYGFSPLGTWPVCTLKDEVYSVFNTDIAEQEHLAICMKFFLLIVKAWWDRDNNFKLEVQNIDVPLIAPNHPERAKNAVKCIASLLAHGSEAKVLVWSADILDGETTALLGNALEVSSVKYFSIDIQAASELLNRIWENIAFSNIVVLSLSQGRFVNAEGARHILKSRISQLYSGLYDGAYEVFKNECAGSCLYIIEDSNSYSDMLWERRKAMAAFQKRPTLKSLQLVRDQQISTSATIVTNFDAIFGGIKFYSLVEWATFKEAEDVVIALLS